MTSGKCGENLTWTLDDDGRLTISGRGKMYNYLAPDDVPWYSSRTLIRKVVLEVGVTTIGAYAFYACKRLTSIIIPDSVTAISNAAFSDCKSLTSVIIPDSVTTIADGAFYDCKSLTSVILPDAVTAIGGMVFACCTSLKKIYYKRGINIDLKYLKRKKKIRYKFNLRSLRVGNNAKLIPYDELPPAQVEPPAAKKNSGWQRDANGTFIYYPSNYTPVQKPAPLVKETTPAQAEPPVQAEPPAQVEPSFKLTPLPTQTSLFDSPPPAETNCTVYKNTKTARAESIAPPNAKSWKRVDENIAEIRRAAELAAMNIVMTIERDLGFSPEDVSSQNLGYDIKSTSRDGKTLRLIEVKGRHIDAETVTVSRNEIDAALNNSDNFILAIVRLDGDNNETIYIRQPFEQPPDRAALSVNFSIQKLIEVSKDLGVLT